MIAVVPFAHAHLDALVPQPAQAVETGALAIDIGAAGPGFTVLHADRVLMCAGLIENHSAHATAWARLAADKGTAMVAMTRAARRVLDASRYVRIDMLVRTDFAAAHIWARLLGFAREGTMRRYGAAGDDYDLYARIRD